MITDLTSIVFYPPERQCELFLYTTKPNAVIGGIWKYKIPETVALCGGPGFVNAWFIHCIAGEARRLHRKIDFLGDLDPIDLAVFLSLKDEAQALE